MKAYEVGMLVVAIIVVMCFTGCAERQVVYGFRGPAIQNDIYHPTIDPLFKNGDWK